MSLIWSDYALAYFLGFIGLWCSFLVLSGWCHFRRCVLNRLAVQRGWMGHATLAGIGFGMAITTPNGEEDYEILGQFVLLSGWPLAFIAIGIGCLIGGLAHGNDACQYRLRVLSPDWKRYGSTVVLTAVVSALVGSILWRIVAL